MSESDRELLELSAKAVGLCVYEGMGGLCAWDRERGARIWSPRTDDGDAFRLECDLSLSVSWGLWAVTVAAGKPWQSFELFKDHGDDKAAARRAATLRAAAKIGRRMA